MIKYFEITKGTPSLYLADATTKQGIDIIAWVGSQFASGGGGSDIEISQEFGDNKELAVSQKRLTEEFTVIHNSLGMKVDYPQYNSDKEAIDQQIEYARGEATYANSRVSMVETELEEKANTDGDYPDMSVGMAVKVKGVNEVQEKLTLTTKSNGNIVIGNLEGQSKEFMPATPSGDPMHYAYVAAGAVWNATSSKWELNGLTDITSAQMSKIYSQTLWMYTKGISAGDLAYATCVTNITPISGYINASGVFETLVNVGRGGMLKVFNLGFPNPSYTLKTKNIQAMFMKCPKLEQILGIIDLSSITTATLQRFFLQECSKLESVSLYGLKLDLDLSTLPSLSVESAVYMLQNANSTAEFTITFHASKQVIYEADAEYISVRDAKPNITILYK